MSTRKYRVPCELFHQEHFGRWSYAVAAEDIWFENLMRQHLQHHEYGYIAAHIGNALHQTMENRIHSKPTIEGDEWNDVVDVLDKLIEAAVANKH